MASVEARERIQDGSRFRAYLLRIAYRLLCRHLRDAYQRPEPELDSLSQVNELGVQRGVVDVIELGRERVCFGQRRPVIAGRQLGLDHREPGPNPVDSIGDRPRRIGWTSLPGLTLAAAWIGEPLHGQRLGLTREQQIDGRLGRAPLTFEAGSEPIEDHSIAASPRTTQLACGSWSVKMAVGPT